MLTGQFEQTQVTIITTGGTIEKTYDERHGALINKKSFIKALVSKKLRLPNTKVEVIRLFNKDSLDLTDQDRYLILDKIKEIARLGRPIIVLHGTDTMEITAAMCKEKCNDIAVPVIFTGAMKPVGFENSDAIQNLTEALVYSKVMPHGVYISFHSQIFPGDKATKNRLKSTFEAKSPKPNHSPSKNKNSAFI